MALTVKQRQALLFGAHAEEVDRDALLGRGSATTPSTSAPAEPEAAEPAAGDDEAVAEEAVEPSTTVEKFAIHVGNGWYELSDSDDKKRGREAVEAAGYAVIQED